MPLELGIWRIDDKCQRIEVSSITDESRLENFLEKDISIASPNWMVIGRQVQTDYGSIIDLLAIDRDGNLIVIELKRDRTPRDVVAQVLDYASWVKNLDDDDIGRIFTAYLSKYHRAQASQSIDKAFCARFQVKEMPENLNEQQELVVVASSLDESTERIVTHLSGQYGVPINVIFFRVFKDGNNEYLTRAWFIDPTEVASVSQVGKERGEWNHEFYVSFGHGERRNWDDARKFGFISAGGGSWYSQTLQTLEHGNRIWVNVPGLGFVGVGIVQKPVVRVDQFMVTQDKGKEVPIKDLPLKAPDMLSQMDNSEKAEYLVGIEWIHTRPLSEAIKERGFFGNQNTVCQPTSKRWDFTISRLKQPFGVKD